MRVMMYSTRSYEITGYKALNRERHMLEMVSHRLTTDTVNLAKGCIAVLVFVSDDLSAPVLESLAALGVKMIICRSAGVDHVDLESARRLGLVVANCPKYSPAAVAEFAVGLLLALDRKIVLAHERILQHDFTLDPLLGTELGTKTIGIIGTGSIGMAFARIMAGFGARLLAADPVENPHCIALGVEYCSQHELFTQADMISIHTPLVPATHYLINEHSLAKMKSSVLIINTARGAVVDTVALIAALEAGKIAGYAADVYEHERGIYFEDYTQKDLNDPLLEKLLQMPQVLMTPHQGFFTDTALHNMAMNVFENLEDFERNGVPTYVV